MEPRVVVFALKADPRGVERLGAYLADGSVVDLQAAHVSMRGTPAPLLRDRTAFRLGAQASLALVADVLAWVDSQRPPGTALKPELVRVVDAPRGGHAPP